MDRFWAIPFLGRWFVWINFKAEAINLQFATAHDKINAIFIYSQNREFSINICVDLLLLLLQSPYLSFKYILQNSRHKQFQMHLTRNIESHSLFMYRQMCVCVFLSLLTIQRRVDTNYDYMNNFCLKKIYTIIFYENTKCVRINLWWTLKSAWILYLFPFSQ